MSEQWAPDWSNAVFSLEERDRRWARVRSLMARDGIDLIVCFPLTHQHGRGAADARYLTQLGENSDEVTVAFPIEGPVTAWLSRGGVWPSSNWFTDIRAADRGTGGKTIAAYLKEHPEFASGTIAVAGLTVSPIAHVRTAEGNVNWASYEILRSAAPKGNVISGTPVLGEARWRKSAEEISFLRKGVEIAELELAALVKHARPGVRERHLYAQMMFANADADGSFHPMVGWISGPRGNTYHRLEQPSFRSLQFGDVISVEVEGIWGGYHAQLDQTIAIGEAPQEMFDAMECTWETFDRVLAELRPGITIGDVIDAGERAGMLGNRLRSGVGMHGRGTGNDGPLLVALRPESPEVRDVVIEEGCCFNLKPSVELDGRDHYCRWGDSVVVTAAGAERLGTRVRELPVCK